MRAATFLGLLILGLAFIIGMPAITTGQPGGFGGKGNKGGGFGGGGFDAGAIFDRIANGRPSIPISEIRTRQPEMLQQFLKERGITNGQVTRQQYVDYLQQAMARVTANQGGGGGGKGTPFAPPSGGPGGGIDISFGKGKGGFGGGSPFGQGGGMSGQSLQLNPEALNQAADVEFRRRDANGDSKLNSDEMGSQLRGNLQKYDKNGDTFIDLNEFRDYFTARILGGDEGQATRGIASIIIEEEELDRKPVVFRAGGKMPDGLPSWFKELDIDTDAQIALWEWRKGGKSIDEFTSWDLNDDGFITPDEAVRQQLALNKASGIGEDKSSSGGFGKGGKKGGGFGGFGGPSTDGTSTPRPGMGNGGGFPKGGFGGGFGGFGKGGKKNSR